MKKTWLCGLYLLSSVVFAEDLNKYKSCYCWVSSVKLAQSFPFTDAQKQKITPLLKQYLDSKNQILAEIKTIDSDYKATLKTEPLDEAKLKDLAKRKIDLFHQKIHNSHEFQLTMFKMLNAEQKKAWHDIFKEPIKTQLTN